MIEADYLSLFPVSNSWLQEQLHYSAISKNIRFGDALTQSIYSWLQVDWPSGIPGIVPWGR